MKKIDCGCAPGCRLDMDRLKGQAAIGCFQRNRPGCEPEECTAQTIAQTKENK